MITDISEFFLIKDAKIVKLHPVNLLKLQGLCITQYKIINDKF